METRTQIGSLGEFALIDRLTSGFTARRKSTMLSFGDDAAVIDNGTDTLSLISTDLLMEGIDFDLTYFPLKHLGYKAAVRGISDICAMNGTAEQLTVAVGVSARFAVEDLESLYSGIRRACEDYSVDLVGGDTSSSLTGLTICVTALGTVSRDSLVRRSGAQRNDIVCITGDMGSAYMGLQLLQREKRVFEGDRNPQPQFDGYEYLLRRQLSPEARTDIVDALRQASLKPTSMIDISDGLASDLMQICRSSSCGVRIYLDRIPLSEQTGRLAEEMGSDPVVAALNGGDDYELLFTVPMERKDDIAKVGGIDAIGYITSKENGAILVTPDGGEIELKAQGFPNGI